MASMELFSVSGASPRKIPAVARFYSATLSPSLRRPHPPSGLFTSIATSIRNPPFISRRLSPVRQSVSGESNSDVGTEGEEDEELEELYHEGEEYEESDEEETYPIDTDALELEAENAVLELTRSLSRELRIGASLFYFTLSKPM